MDRDRFQFWSWADPRHERGVDRRPRLHSPKEFLEQGLAIEKPEILAHLIELELGTIGGNQCANVLQILGAPRIVDEALELQPDQCLCTDHAQLAESRMKHRRAGEHANRGGSVRKDEVHSFVTAQEIGGIGISMQASIAERDHGPIDCIGLVRVREQIDVLGGPQDLVGRESETADESEARGDRVQGGDDLFELLSEAGNCGHGKRLA
ncbi:MAG: hypothetical protein IT518_27970 [Burkholderiales bacterium]|nr:hypothetical protein [Burkholderiales bacterium]